MSIDDLTISGQRHSPIWKLEHSVITEEDLIQKLQKLADLMQKGLLTEEEFQKLKMVFTSAVLVVLAAIALLVSGISNGFASRNRCI